MISSDVLSKFIRYYFVAYRLEHDIDWVKSDSSLYGYELAVQAGKDKAEILEKGFKGDSVVVDKEKGEIIVKQAINPISMIPSASSILAKLKKIATDIPGATFQVQFLIAPKDKEFSEGYDRDQKWQWLISSLLLSELFLLGEVSEKGELEYTGLFHSCHQADHNRDLVEDCRVMMEQWEKGFTEVADSYGITDEINSLLQNMDAPKAYAPCDETHEYLTDDEDESEKILSLCKAWGVEESRAVSINDRKVISKLNVFEMADVLFSIRHSKLYQLFGSER
ncbi:hypothetical protein IJT10_01120 [bacterium]|nr:hypothetical protein [bacterium]